MKRNNVVLKIALLILCVVLLVIIFSFGDVHLTENQARDRAVERLDGYCKNARIDRSLVRGPEYLGPSRTGYTFEWIASLPNKEETTIDIWVSFKGETKVTLEKAKGTK